MKGFLAFKELCLDREAITKGICYDRHSVLYLVHVSSKYSEGSQISLLGNGVRMEEALLATSRTTAELNCKGERCPLEPVGKGTR